MFRAEENPYYSDDVATDRAAFSRCREGATGGCERQLNWTLMRRDVTARRGVVVFESQKRLLYFKAVRGTKNRYREIMVYSVQLNLVPGGDFSRLSSIKSAD